MKFQFAFGGWVEIAAIALDMPRVGLGIFAWQQDLTAGESWRTAFSLEISLPGEGARFGGVESVAAVRAGAGIFAAQIVFVAFGVNLIERRSRVQLVVGRRFGNGKRRLGFLPGKILAVLVGLIAGALFLAITFVILWPFRQLRLIHSLELLSVCAVKAQTFEPTFFPEPGYVATGLRFERRENGKFVVLATVRRLRGRVSWFSLLSLDHRIRELHADGLHIEIPTHVPQAPNYPSEERLQAMVSHLTAPGAELDVHQRAGVPKLHIAFSRLDVGQIAKGHPMSIAATAHNDSPSADILLNGQFGPLIWSDTKRTPTALRLRIIQLDMNHFQSVGGIAMGDVEATGPFDHLRVSGSIQIPDFHASNSRRSTRLTVDGSAILNGTTGNTWILGATSRFLNSEMQVSGNVLYGPNNQRNTTLLLTSAHARIEDLLALYWESRPPLEGLTTLKGQVSFAAGPQPILKRVKLAGDFSIASARFRNRKVQGKLDGLSFRVRKIKVNKKRQPGPVQSLLSGKLLAENGQAVFQAIQLASPGLHFRGSGTLNLLTEQLDLNGSLQTQTSLSRAVGGFKGMIAFPLNPLFRSKQGGAAIPFRIFGSLDSPSFKMSFRKRQQSVRSGG